MKEKNHKGYRIWKFIGYSIFTFLIIMTVTLICIGIYYEDKNAPSDLDFSERDEFPLPYIDDISILEEQVSQYAEKYKGKYYKDLYFDGVSFKFALSKEEVSLKLLEFYYVTKYKKEYGNIIFRYDVKEEIISAIFGDFQKYREKDMLLKDNHNVKNNMSHYIFYKNKALKKLKDIGYEQEEEEINFYLFFADNRIYTSISDVQIEFDKEKGDFIVVTEEEDEE